MERELSLMLNLLGKCLLLFNMTTLVARSGISKFSRAYEVDSQIVTVPQKPLIIPLA